LHLMLFKICIVLVRVSPWASSDNVGDIDINYNITL
jgi:hypothetical protein